MSVLNPFPIVLFDGVCNLCHKSVQFCIKHEDPDLDPLLHFASLQSETGQKVLSENQLPSDYLESVLLRDVDGKLYSKSEGVFKLTKYLKFPYSWISIFSVLPLSITDGIYDLIAKSRYSVFGKLDQCMLPPVDKDMKDRFLS